MYETNDFLPQGCNGAIQVKIADTDNEKQQKRLLTSLTTMAPLPALQAYQQVSMMIMCLCLYRTVCVMVLCVFVVTKATNAAAVRNGNTVSR